MASTSPERLARQLLEECLSGRDWSREALLPLLDSCGQPQGVKALFAELVEPLGDRFEPRLVDCYVSIFSEAVARFVPGRTAREILHRYQRIRHGNPAFKERKVDRVYVLSRITLGADIVVSSQFLAAAAALFPSAEIFFVGPLKNFELFAGNPRLQLVDLNYGRSGLLTDRLKSGLELATTISGAYSLVFDPDSRLTQLGLLPVVDDDQYVFFESRAYGAEGSLSIGELTGRWIVENLGYIGASPWVNPVSPPLSSKNDIAVSFGFGGNPAKRVGEAFESEIVRSLTRMGLGVVLDEGGSPEERALARSIAAATGCRTHQGSFASFCRQIEASKLYIGYDSAGQHAAAALGVSSITAFRGWVDGRMLARWSPRGKGRNLIIPVTNEPELEIATRVFEEASLLLKGEGP